MTFCGRFSHAVSCRHDVVITEERIAQRGLDAAAGHHASEDKRADHIRPEVEVYVSAPEDTDPMLGNSHLVRRGRIRRESAVPLGRPSALEALAIHKAAA